MIKWILIVSTGLSAGLFYQSSEGKSRPFQGMVHAIPGTIEAEHFDEGEDGIAYRDVERKNQGAPYRETGVDIEGKLPGASGQYAIGWIKAGEWLAYTVHVKQSGPYTLEIGVVSKGRGGTFHVEFDGKDVTGTLQIPDTGAWTVRRVVTKSGILLDAGPQNMRVVMDTNGDSGYVGDIDYFRFAR